MNRNNQIILGVAAVAAAGVGAWTWSRSGSSDGVVYKTAPVEKRDLRQTVSATGIIQPMRVVDIKSRAGGEIKTLVVEVGDFVKKGQLIATIDPTDSRTALQQAQADVASGRARISQAEQTLTLQRQTSLASVQQSVAAEQSARAQVRVAQVRLEQSRKQSAVQPALSQAEVRQAQASLVSAEQQLEQLRGSGDPQARADARSTLESAQATLTNAELNLKRQQQLAGERALSRKRRKIRPLRNAIRRRRSSTARKCDSIPWGQGQQAQIRAAQARVAEAREAVRNAETNRVQIELRRQDIKSAEASVAQAQAALAQASANLATARANQMQIGIRAADIETAKAAIARANAQRDNAQIVLGQTTIVAPRDGVVLQKLVEEGTIISSGSAFSSGGGQSIVQLGDSDPRFRGRGGGRDGYCQHQGRDSR